MQSNSGIRRQKPILRSGCRPHQFVSEHRRVIRPGRVVRYDPLGEGSVEASSPSLAWVLPAVMTSRRRLRSATAQQNSSIPPARCEFTGFIGPVLRPSTPSSKFETNVHCKRYAQFTNRKRLGSPFTSVSSTISRHRAALPTACIEPPLPDLDLHTPEARSETNRDFRPVRLNGLEGSS